MPTPPPASAAPLPTVAAAPTFHLLHSQPPRTSAFLLGAAGSLIALTAVMAALGHAHQLKRARHAAPGSPSAASAAGASGVPAPPSDDDDPDAFDTIVLADPADAPTPAPHSDREPSPVHPFAVVHLPRFGADAGMIPDTPTGRALYAWLAAFNHDDPAALAAALPPDTPAASIAAQRSLRHQTGGLALLSAREIAPGLMVVRMRDQTTQTEALGSLQLRPSAPPTIASFSLRAVAAP